MFSHDERLRDRHFDAYVERVADGFDSHHLRGRVLRALDRIRRQMHPIEGAPTCVPDGDEPTTSHPS